MYFLCPRTGYELFRESSPNPESYAMDTKELSPAASETTDKKKKGFFSGFSGFPPSIKINTSKFQFDLEIIIYYLLFIIIIIIIIINSHYY